MIKRFSEYMDTKCKINKPKVKVVAGDVDMPKDRTKQPPKGVGMKNGKQPYIGDKGVVRGSQKAFGEQGQKELVYDVSKETKPSKLPTADENLPTSETFALFPRVREAIKENPTLIENLVRDLKRHGLFALLVAEVSDHPESFTYFAEIMASKEYGPDFCRKLARAMSEDVSMPFSKSADDGADVDPNMPPPEEGDPGALDNTDQSMEDPDEEDLDDDDLDDGDEEDEDEEDLEDTEDEPAEGLPTDADPNQMMDPSQQMMDPSQQMAGGMPPMPGAGMSAPMAAMPPPAMPGMPPQKPRAFENFQEALSRYFFPKRG